MPKTAAAQAGTKRKGEGQEGDESKRTRRPENQRVINYIEKFVDKVENGQDREEDLESRLQISKSEVRLLRQQLAELKGLLNASRRTSNQLFEEKEDLKMDLMKQQPMTQLSDAEVADMYEGLQRNISSWVDGEVAAFEKEWIETHQTPKVPLNLNIFNNPPWPEESQFLAAGHGYGGDYLVESLIHARLHEALFRDEMIFFALDGQESRFLQTAGYGLVHATPPRDRSIVRYLVSELLKGLSSSATFFERRQNLASEMEIELLADIEKTLPKLRRCLGRMERLRHRVIEPALDFAVAIRTSATCYAFSCRMTSEVRFAQKDFGALDSNNCIMINVDTRQTVKVDKASFDGANIKRVLLLSPALQRKDAGKAVKYLTPDRVCVKVDVLPPSVAPAAFDCATTSQSPAKGKFDKLGRTRVESSQRATSGQAAKEGANEDTHCTPAVDIKIEDAAPAANPGAAWIGAASLGVDLAGAADVKAERHDVPHLKSYDFRSRKE